MDAELPAGTNLSSSTDSIDSFSRSRCPRMWTLTSTSPPGARLCSTTRTRGLLQLCGHRSTSGQTASHQLIRLARVSDATAMAHRTGSLTRLQRFLKRQCPRFKTQFPPAGIRCSLVSIHGGIRDHLNVGDDVLNQHVEGLRGPHNSARFAFEAIALPHGNRRRRGRKVETPDPSRLRKQGVKLWADGSPWVGSIASSFPYLDTPTVEAQIPARTRWHQDDELLPSSARRHSGQARPEGGRCHST